jgi:two-component system sensor kinase FixL
LIVALQAIADDVFKPYMTTKKGGLGMGLMMCRTIVESHGGTLSLKPSRARGARFDIQLPIAQ